MCVMPCLTSTSRDRDRETEIVPLPNPKDNLAQPGEVEFKDINILCNFLSCIFYLPVLRFIKGDDTFKKVGEAAIWLCGDLYTVLPLDVCLSLPRY